MTPRLVVSACLWLVMSIPAWGQPTAGRVAALADWSSVLERFVDASGRTDFRALAQDRAALDRYVDWLSSHGPRSTPEAYTSTSDILAYHINAYNALAMHGVIERKIPDNFSSFFKRASFFRFRTIVVDGDETNLYDYENDVIRSLGEPRVHFALNCMVRSCPRLPRQPFVGATLDAELEALTRAFFDDDLHLQLDANRKVVKVSAILDFYTGDFVATGRADDLIPYVNRYLTEPVPADYRVRFLKYDWRINQQP